MEVHLHLRVRADILQDDAMVVGEQSGAIVGAFDFVVEVEGQAVNGFRRSDGQ